jgi:hypothetical protein
MTVQPTVAVRTEAIVKPTDRGAAPSGDNGVSDIRLVKVPAHWPPVDLPPANFPPAPRLRAGSAPQEGGPDPAHLHRADLGDGGQAWSRQFAVLLAEALAGVRPARQLLPWLSERGASHLRRLLPLFADGHRPHVARVLTAQPAEDVIEMTLVVTVGPRTRALAVRLERTRQAQRPTWSQQLASPSTKPRSAAPARWRCTDIEAG